MTQEMLDQLEAVERCCRVSAMMLEMADHRNPKVQDANQGQAALLRQAADILEAMRTRP